MKIAIDYKLFHPFYKITAILKGMTNIVEGILNENLPQVIKFTDVTPTIDKEFYK